MKRTEAEIIGAYEKHGSVWRAAKALGMSGQAVHERLRAAGHPMLRMKWSNPELDELRRLVGTTSISEIAAALGRPYAGVAIKISRLGLSHHPAVYHRLKKIPKGSGYTKEKTLKWIKELKAHEGSLRAFCTTRGLSIDMLVNAIQIYGGDFWDDYSSRKGAPEPETCAYCEAPFYPMNARQKTCSRKCQGARLRDEKYFGGKRKQAIGLLDGECQMCLRQVETGLSAHHLIGKENDPENDYLVALCRGCHQIVGQLAGRKFADDKVAWERLIIFVMSRRLADKGGEFVGVEATVDLDWLTEAEVLDAVEGGMTVAF